MEKKIREEDLETIKAAKEGFEKSFKEKTLYNKQTQDSDHLERIIEILNIKDKDEILDLGTGSGYLAFRIAKENTSCKVTGLDIVEKALEEDRNRARELGMSNISFVSYKGNEFPFENNSFNIVTTRYALHHFPKIKDTFSEVARVLKEEGFFFISDPTPNKEDIERFVDDYMRMKKDGHIKYYTKEEYESLASEAGFSLVNSFETEITFPRLKETAIEFDEIIEKHDKNIIDGYNVRVTEDNKYIYITQKVLNLLIEIVF